MTVGKILKVSIPILKHRLLVGFLVILWALSDWGIPKSVLGNISYRDRTDSREKSATGRSVLKIPPKLPTPDQKSSTLGIQAKPLNQSGKADKNDRDAREQELERENPLPVNKQAQTTSSPKPETTPGEPAGVKVGRDEVNFTPKLAIALSLGLFVGVLGMSAFLFGVVRKLKRENADLRNQFLRQGQALASTETSLQIEGVRPGTLNVNGTVNATPSARYDSSTESVELEKKILEVLNHQSIHFFRTWFQTLGEDGVQTYFWKGPLGVGEECPAWVKTLLRRYQDGRVFTLNPVTGFDDDPEGEFLLIEDELDGVNRRFVIPSLFGQTNRKYFKEKLAAFFDFPDPRDKQLLLLYPAEVDIQGQLIRKGLLYLANDGKWLPSGQMIVVGQNPEGIKPAQYSSIGWPAPIESLHRSHTSKGSVSHHPIDGFTFSDEGQFELLDVGTEKLEYFYLLPKLDRFFKKADYHKFHGAYDCSDPKSGKVWIEVLAILSKDLKLLRKGILFTTP